MSGTNANMLTNPAVSASGELKNILIERFTGYVNEAMMRVEGIERLFEVQDVIGTNMITSKSIGDTQIQVITAGQEAEATSIELDNHSLNVDAVVMARNTIAMLHLIQSDIQLQQKTARSHVKKLTQLKDETLLTQIIKGSVVKDGRVSGHFGGTAVILGSKGDELDSVKYLRAMEGLVLQLNEKEVDNMDMIFACPWAQFYVLMDSDKLTSTDYVPGADNGSKVSGWIIKAYGFHISPTNRIRQIPQADGVHHELSNAGNGYRYDTSQDIRGCMGILFGREALLVGRTMAQESDIFFNKRLKTTFIDTWESYAAIADRYEYCGALFASPDWSPSNHIKRLPVNQASVNMATINGVRVNLNDYSQD